MAKFEITVRKNGEFQFNLKASNGEVILTSEGYTTKSACLNGVESVKKNALEEKRFEKLVAKNGKPYFTLKATNGQIIGQSQMYASERNRNNGIASVMKNAPVAEIVERYPTAVQGIPTKMLRSVRGAKFFFRSRKNNL